MSEGLSIVLHAWADLAMRQSMESNRLFMFEHGFSFPQMNSLIFIYHHSFSTINQLSCHLGISKAAASQMIERLVDFGLVNREVDPRDRRSKRLTLTEMGENLVREAEMARHAWIDEFCQTFDPDESERIAQNLEILVERMRTYKENETKIERGGRKKPCCD